MRSLRMTWEQEIFKTRTNTFKTQPTDLKIEYVE